MAIRSIRIWPDPALKQIARPVEAFDAALRTLVDDLFETMYEANGVGLAATQVAVALRVLVIDLDPHETSGDDPEAKAELRAAGFKKPIVLINPEIVAHEGTIEWDEGCLSVPGVSETVQRHEHISVRAFNVASESFTLKASRLFAVAIQHEMDHLDGKVFVDYLSRLKRDLIRKRMEKLKTDVSNDGVIAAQAL